jgi:predicted CoA-binding protein
VVASSGSPEIDSILTSARTVLLVDWPSRDIPETLARAGYRVFVQGGLGPLDYSEYWAKEDGVDVSRGLAAPEAIDLMYIFRPLAELAALVDVAKAMGATAIWYQSGLSEDGVRDPQGCWLPEAESTRARSMVESQGLVYVEQPHLLKAISLINS